MTLKVEYDFHPDGTLDKIWRNEEGQYHREDGPAYEYADGVKFWFKNGRLHREDGPALVWGNGKHEYFMNDKKYTKEEYWEKMRGKKK